MGLALVTPAASPVSIEEAKAWCRVEDSASDALITSLVSAAVGMVEEYTGRALATQDWLLTLDGFCDEIELPRGPVTAVAADGVKYFDEDDVEQTLDPSAYQLDLVSDPQRIVRDPDESWPVVGDIVNPVQITFTTGYGTLPHPLRIAVLMLVAQWFDNRAATNVGNITSQLPLAFDAMISPYRRIVI